MQRDEIGKFVVLRDVALRKNRRNRKKVGIEENKRKKKFTIIVSGMRRG